MWSSRCANQKPPPVLGLPSLGHPLHPAARAARTSPRLGADALSERDGALPKGAGRQSTRGDRNGAGHTSLLTSVSVIPAGCGATFVSLFGTKSAQATGEAVTSQDEAMIRILSRLSVEHNWWSFTAST